MDIPEYWRWFSEARFGLFLHWGPYAAIGRGEQVLFREHMDHDAYRQLACAWKPRFYEPRLWAETAAAAGFRYLCLTTRHHDGYCLWDTDQTDYSSSQQAPGRDFVADYVEACRAAKLRVGLYYSLLDWRVPAYFEGPELNPHGWEQMRNYIHAQIHELLTRYGRIDYLFFDGLWPRSTEDIDGVKLLRMIRELQPEILVNNRLGTPSGHAHELGDVGTPEHHIRAESDRLWESCQTTTWRLWGYCHGERWRPAERWLDMLAECTAKGGNLLLNVGPDADGRLPAPFLQDAAQLGDWLRVHGEAIYGADAADVTEFVSYGWQSRKGNSLYLILRFWPGDQRVEVAGLDNRPHTATVLTTGQQLDLAPRHDGVTVTGLPVDPPTALFPVIRLDFAEPPRANQWGRERLWGGDPLRVAEWARSRGESVWTDGAPRQPAAMRGSFNH